MRKRFFFSMFIFASFFVFPFFVQGKIGVGVGTAKIETNEKLKPGGIYELPPLTVRNTGDESSAYAIDIQYHENIPEKRPQREWFEFNPPEFDLEAGETQVVQVALRLPLKLEPGKYFAYVEASPVKKSESKEGAVIGIAAAAKLYFEVIPANLWQALYYKTIYIWKFYAPWTYVASTILIVLILGLILRKFISFDLGSRRKKNVLKKTSASFEEAIAESMESLEKYTARLPERKVEKIFNEMNECSDLIERYFYEDDKRAFKMISRETKKVVALLRESLLYIHKNYPEFYAQAKKTIMSGFTHR